MGARDYPKVRDWLYWLDADAPLAIELAALLAEHDAPKPLTVEDMVEQAIAGIDAHPAEPVEAVLRRFGAEPVDSMLARCVEAGWRMYDAVGNPTGYEVSLNGPDRYVWSRTPNLTFSAALREAMTEAGIE